jgi:membrane associated rhomboid family serine protease
MAKDTLVIAAFTALIGFFVGGAIYGFVGFGRNGDEVSAGVAAACCAMVGGLLSIRDEGIREHRERQSKPGAPPT